MLPTERVRKLSLSINVELVGSREFLHSAG
jgi:hypothetical protein